MRSLLIFLAIFPIVAVVVALLCVMLLWAIAAAVVISAFFGCMFYGFIWSMYCDNLGYDWQAPYNNLETLWWFLEYHGMKYRGELD